MPKPSHDLLDYLGVILPAILGFLTIGVLSAQVWLLRRSNSTAELQATLVEKQAQIAQAQTEIAEKQRQLSERQFLADHRPKIFVRAVIPDREITRAQKSIAQFTLANIGETEAEISEIGTTLVCANASGAINSTRLQFERSEKVFHLANGQERVCFSPTPIRNGDFAIATNRRWYCIGYIRYRGQGDSFDRLTGFLRVWDHAQEIWVPEPSDQFEYNP